MSKTKPPGRPSPEALALHEAIRANRSLGLKRLFQSIATSALLASATGCAISAPPPPENMTCVDEGWRPTQGINPDGAYDYLGVYRAGQFTGELRLMDEDGTACETAADAAACMTALESAEPFSNQLRTTNGDGVQIIDTVPKLSAFLGTIDTADEALLVVFRAGFSVNCGAEHVSVQEVSGGFEVWATKITSGCDPVETTRFHFMVRTDGTMTELERVVIESEGGVCIGRRPDGLVARKSERASEPLARFYEEVARLEHSAIAAFTVLADELRHHGAPPELIDACLRAADDEARHTEAMGKLAVRLGAEVAPAEVEPRPIRDLYAIACENAVEGCIRETFGALVGVHQSLAANDEQIKREMRLVAEDETRHAELSWQIAAWIEPRLTAEQRNQLEMEKRSAIETLRAEMRVPVADVLEHQAGLPAPEHAVQMLDQLASTLWA